MKIHEALSVLHENGYIVNESLQLSFDEYKKEIKDLLKYDFDYYNVDWVDKEYWDKLIKELYSKEKDTRFAAEVLYQYETEEQEHFREEQAWDAAREANYDFERGDVIY